MVVTDPLLYLITLVLVPNQPFWAQFKADIPPERELKSEAWFHGTFQANPAIILVTKGLIRSFSGDVQKDDQLVHQRYANDIPHPWLFVIASALFLTAAATQGSSKVIETSEGVIGIGSRHKRENLLRTCSTETEEVNTSTCESLIPLLCKEESLRRQCLSR